MQVAETIFITDMCMVGSVVTGKINVEFRDYVRVLDIANPN